MRHKIKAMFLIVFLLTVLLTGLSTVKAETPLLQLVCTHNDGAEACRGVWNDSSYTYGAFRTEGLRAYSFDGTAFTLLDTKDYGDNIANESKDVIVSGNIIFGTFFGDGIYSYTFNGVTFTEKDHGTHRLAASDRIWFNDSSVYHTTQSYGPQLYTFDGAGTLTYRDEDWYDDEDMDLWHDGTYLYVAQEDHGVSAYDINANTFVRKDQIDNGSDCYGVFGDGTYIYATYLTGGIYAYTFDGTTLSYVAHSDDGGGYTRVWCDNGYIYVSCQSEGLRLYSFDGASFTLHQTYSDGATFYDGMYNNDYFFSATSAGIKVFTCDIDAPSVTTNSETGVSYANATLQGTLSDTGNKSCFSYFEYGETVAYGNKVYATETSTTYDIVDDTGDGSTNTQYPLVGTYSSEKLSVETTVYPTKDINVSSISVNIGTTTGSDYGCLCDIYIAQEGPDLTPMEGTLVKNDWDPGWSTGTKTIHLDTEYQLLNNTLYSINFVTDSKSGTANSINLRADTSGGQYRMYFGGSNTDYTAYGDIIFNGNGTLSQGDFSANVQNLKPNTVYHYRAVANNTYYTTSGSDGSFTTLNSLTTNTSTSVLDTTADLNGYIHYGDGTGSYGFWYNTTEVNATSPGTNVTTGTNPSSATSFTESIASLSKGQYYYARSWQKSDNFFTNATNMSHFLTNPGTPTSVQVTSEDASGINLSWTSGTHAVTNTSTIIRYSSTGYPTNINDGEGGTNTTLSYHKFTGLSGGTTYFSLWTYVNASGSPLLHAYSSSPSYTFGTMPDYRFNVTVRYENTTHELVNLTKGFFHKMIVHLSNATYYIYFNSTGEIDTELSTIDVNLSGTVEESGTIQFNATANVDFIEFYWNWTEDVDTDILQHTDSADISDPTDDLWFSLTHPILEEYTVTVEVYNLTLFDWILVPSTKYTYYSTNDTIEIDDSFLSDNTSVARITYYYQSSTPYRCRRVIIPQNQSGATFYILTSKEIYGETTASGASMLDTLVNYNYNFLDYSGNYFNLYDNPFAFIYILDEEGNIRVIHSEYLDTDWQVHPQLLYQKMYRIGVQSDIAYDGYIAIAPTSDEINPTVSIPYDIGFNYTFTDLITYNYGWTSNSLYFNYSDADAHATVNVTFYVYFMLNDTYVTGSFEYSNNDDHNFSFTVGEGCNLSEDYYAIITTTINTLDDSSDANDDYTGTYYFVANYFALVNYSYATGGYIEKVITDLVGDSPVYSWERPGVHVPFIYLIMFILCFWALTSFNKTNGYVGLLASGLVMILLSSLIAGLEILWQGSAYAFWGSVSTIVVGGFMCAIGIVGIMGGVETR